MYLTSIKIARIQHFLDHCEIQVLMQGTMIVRNETKKQNYPKCYEGCGSGLFKYNSSSRLDKVIQ